MDVERHDPGRTVLVWCHDSIAIIDKLLAFGAWLRSLGYRPVWVSRGRATQLAFTLRGEVAYALVDCEPVEKDLIAASTLDNATCDSLGDFEARSGARVLSLPAVAAGYHRQLVRLLDGFWQILCARYRPCAMIVLNGQTAMARTLVAGAGKARCPVWYWENGLLPETLVFDRDGVNAASSAARWGRVDDWGYQPTRQQTEAFAAWYREWRRNGETLVNAGRASTAGAVRAGLRITPESRVVLVPLQVETDTNIILHSPAFQHMQVFADFLQRAVAERSDIVLLFKDHPKRVRQQPAVPGLQLSDSRHRYVAEGHLHSLLDASDAVITINSTVGFEALLRGMPVICCGHSSYSGKGLTQDLLHGEDDLAELQGLLVRPFNGWSSDARRRALFATRLMQRHLFATGADPLGSRGFAAEALIGSIEHMPSAGFPELPSALRIVADRIGAAPAGPVACAARHYLLLADSTVHPHVHLLAEQIQTYRPGASVRLARASRLNRWIARLRGEVVLDCRD